MKPIKFWAYTKEDTENFFNYLRAMNIPDDLSWADSDYIRAAQKDGIGWLVDAGDVTYYSGKSGYYENEAKEFFFPIPVEEFVETSETDGQVVSDGGSSSYYDLTITNIKGEHISCKVGDVIRAMVGNDFDLGNILKACRRMYEASQGRGKKDVSMHYDANKIAYFSKEFADWNEDNEK